MPSVIVVDDVPAARRVLIRLLQAHPDVRVLGEAESVAEARDLLGGSGTGGSSLLVQA